MTLDVFLESDVFDRERVEAALARTGIAADSVVATADGGEASVSIDDDGCVFVVRSLSPELAGVLFDAARAAGLAILPADGTPTAFVAGLAEAPDDLEPLHVEASAELYDALRQSVTRRKEARGARSA